ncbi:MAG: hypothetical protein KIS92_15215 [Planctomycetota bacterium]|nr:hypothetical protein [Planctomycetota bacterium]
MRTTWRIWIIAIFFVPACLRASDAGWSLAPAADHGYAKEPYAPAFEKHFKLENGVLRGTAGLGDEFYKEMEAHNVFVGPGVVWASKTDWPKDAANFELVFDYKWFQEEPMTKFGDFPDLRVGFRLDKDGAGYDLQWGMLGQIRLTRKDKDGSVAVAHGTLPGMKGKWARVKIRAAGPILKIKIWNAEKPEPETWSAEGYDDWSGAKEPSFKSGAVALGFCARKLFDTCVYEYKDASLTVLTPEQAAAEVSFDAKTAPAYIGLANNSDTSPIKTAEPAVAFKDPKDLGEVQADANAKLAAGDGAVTIASADGKTAFVWRKVNPKAKYVCARMKSATNAFPLFAVKTKSANGKETIACLDPAWRKDLVALWWQSPAHTAAAFRWTWKPEAWHDFVVENAHWQKWQILDTTDPKNRAAYAAKLTGGAEEMWIGFGVQGAGLVSVQGMTEK